MILTTSKSSKQLAVNILLLGLQKNSKFFLPLDPEQVNLWRIKFFFAIKLLHSGHFSLCKDFPPGVDDFPFPPPFLVAEFEIHFSKRFGFLFPFLDTGVLLDLKFKYKIMLRKYKGKF